MDIVCSLLWPMGPCGHRVCDTTDPVTCQLLFVTFRAWWTANLWHMPSTHNLKHPKLSHPRMLITTVIVCHNKYLLLVTIHNSFKTKNECNTSAYKHIHACLLIEKAVRQHLSYNSNRTALGFGQRQSTNASWSSVTYFRYTSSQFRYHKRWWVLPEQEKSWAVLCMVWSKTWWSGNTTMQRDL